MQGGGTAGQLAVQLRHLAEARPTERAAKAADRGDLAGGHAVGLLERRARPPLDLGARLVQNGEHEAEVAGAGAGHSNQAHGVAAARSLQAEGHSNVASGGHPGGGRPHPQRNERLPRQ